MSTLQHRTDQVYAVIRQLVESGTTEFRPGHIADALRAANTPLLTYEIRGELSNLRHLGLVDVDPDTALWRLTAEARKAG